MWMLSVAVLTTSSPEMTSLYTIMVGLVSVVGWDVCVCACVRETDDGWNAAFIPSRMVVRHVDRRRSSRASSTPAAIRPAAPRPPDSAVQVERRARRPLSDPVAASATSLGGASPATMAAAAAANANEGEQSQQCVACLAGRSVVCRSPCGLQRLAPTHTPMPGRLDEVIWAEGDPQGEEQQRHAG